MAITNSPTVSSQRLRGQFNKNGGTPEDDQGEGRVSEIPADVIEAVNAAFKRDELDNTLLGIVARAILAERQRIADDLFHRNGFMLAKTGDGKHSVEISFRTLEEMHEFHRVLCELSRFKSRGPSLPSSLPKTIKEKVA